MKFDFARNAKRNVLASGVNNAVKTVFPFVNRTLFLWLLGPEYLGLNGLFVSILGVLSLAELGFPSGGKRYVPHITLGRSMDPVTEPPAVRCETFTAGSMILFESVFKPGGVSYTALHRETFT